MIPDWDRNGNLPFGIYRPNLKEFKNKFVENEIFSTSTTRRDRFDKYKSYCQMICDLGVATIQWVDGSYITKEINPNDIDVVTHLKGIEVEGDMEKYLTICSFNQPSEHERIHREYNCDTYFIYEYPPDNPKYTSYIYYYTYWLNTFGHEFNKILRIQTNPKGIIEFNITDEQFNNDIKSG